MYKEASMRIRIIYAAILIIFLCGGIAAMPGVCQEQENEVKVIEKGDPKMSERAVNTSCPVSEDPIDPATAIRVEYKGKLYDLCSPGCLRHFRKFPEKFSRKADTGKY